MHSILVPAYNAEKYIEKAISSCLMQSFSDFEVLVSDNASLDLTYELASKFHEIDSRVHIFRQEKNLGMVGNWNWLLSKAKGNTFQILCADDHLLPGFLEEVFKVKKSSNVVFSNAFVASGDVSIENIALYKGGLVSVCRYVWNMHGAPLSSLVFNREDGFSFNADFQFNCDFEYLYRVCLSKGLDLFFIDQPLVGVVIHGENETKRFNVTAENRKLLFFLMKESSVFYHKILFFLKILRLRF